MWSLPNPRRGLLFDVEPSTFDWQFGVLVLFIAGVFLALLKPTPADRGPSAPTEDTRKTWRLP